MLPGDIGHPFEHPVSRTLLELREKLDEFQLDYNFNRPPWALNKKAPADLLPSNQFL